MNGKNILWITENYPPQRGGMSQSCDRLVEGFRKAGANVDIFHFINTQKRIPTKKIFNGRYVPLIIHESEAHTINMAWNAIDTTVKYDYIVSFGSHLSSIASPVFSQWLQAPLVTMIRGNDFDNAIFTPRKRAILNDLINQSSYVFTVSRDKEEKIRRIWQNTQVHYTPNGIDTAEWLPTISESDFANKWKSEHLPKGERCIGLFGDLKLKKGANFLFESLLKTSILTHFHFLLIGEVAPDIKELLSENKISHTIISFKDRYELVKYYLCLDALVIPSFYDGMPNVMMEAGALGIPIIASEVDGMKDLIDNELSGLLFSPGNEDECRKVFFTFHEFSSEKRRELGMNLKTNIENNYTLQHEINQYKKYLR